MKLDILHYLGRESSELGFGLPKLGFANERREGNLLVALSRGIL